MIDVHAAKIGRKLKIRFLTVGLTFSQKAGILKVIRLERMYAKIISELPKLPVRSERQHKFLPALWQVVDVDLRPM